MKVYVIHRTVGGFAREDARESDIVGVVTDPERAKQIRIWAGGDSITEIEVDYLHPGYIQFCKEILKKEP